MAATAVDHADVHAEAIEDRYVAPITVQSFFLPVRHADARSVLRHRGCKTNGAHCAFQVVCAASAYQSHAARFHRHYFHPSPTKMPRLPTSSKQPDIDAWRHAIERDGDLRSTCTHLMPLPVCTVDIICRFAVAVRARRPLPMLWHDARQTFRLFSFRPFVAVTRAPCATEKSLLHQLFTPMPPVQPPQGNQWGLYQSQQRRRRENHSSMMVTPFYKA